MTAWIKSVLARFWIALLMMVILLLFFSLYASLPFVSGSCALQIYHLVGDGVTVDTRFNVLIVGQGFGKGDLDTFRKVAGDLAERLVQIAPFRDHADAINVYRADLITGRPTDDCNGNGTFDDPLCTWCASGDDGTDALPAPDASAAILAGTPISWWLYGALELDLGVQRCWAESPSDLPGDDRFIWLDADGETDALELSMCDPQFQVVVVVANLNDDAGMGSREAAGGSIGLSVIGAPVQNDYGGFPILELSDKAYYLLVHELSHAIGLYDEYSDLDGDVSISFASDMNVWEASRTFEETGTFASAADRTSVPWAMMLEDCPFGPIPCCDAASPGATNSCPVVFHSASCCCRSCSSCSNCTDCDGCTSCSGCGDCSDCTLNRRSDPAGLLEGAHYSEERFFRARDSCWMRVGSSTHCTSDPDALCLCEACLLAISGQLCKYPTETSCPAPGPYLEIREEADGSLRFREHLGSLVMTDGGAASGKIRSDFTGRLTLALFCLKESFGDWVRAEELRASATDHELRVRRTSTGLEWSLWGAADSDWVPLEPSDSGVGTDLVPTELLAPRLESLRMVSEDGDGSMVEERCLEARFRVVP